MTVGAVRAVTLDLGGTLLRVEPSVGEVYAQGAARLGYPVTASIIEQNFRRAWQHSLTRSDARGYRTSDEILREEWRQIVGESFGDLVPATAMDELFEQLYGHFAAGKAWVLAPGVHRSLEVLRAHGLRLGVLSNWDSRITKTIEDLGLSEAFDAVTVSHAVGFEKPHPEIFRHAMRELDSTPANTLHIGDSLLADIQPARTLGLRTLWIASSRDRRDAEDTGPAVSSFLDVDEVAWGALLAPS